MTEKQILKSIKALAAGECANYHGGFCAETDRRCHLINPKYDSIRDGMIDCDYFLECVLPANWELSDLVSYALWYDEPEDDDLPSNMKRYLMYDEDELRSLTEGAISKLKNMTDAEFDELIRENTSDFFDLD